jgi:vitamin B12 transporter
MKRIYRLIALACILGCGQVVFAQTSGDSTAVHRKDNSLDSTQVIKESIIIGTPAGYKYREVIPAQTLKEEELQRLNSFSVADAIRYFSGVQLKDYGGVGGLKTVNIRSCQPIFTHWLGGGEPMWSGVRKDSRKQSVCTIPTASALRK